MTTSMAGKMLLAVALASTLGGLCAGPALADDRDRRHEHQNRAWHREQQRRAWQQEQARAQYERDRRAYHRRQTFRPVYAPAPVITAPAPSPGISIFFPLFR
jgi:hypothetical protein